jgi:tetratricopeptide (TPR) repeat protein
MRLWTWAIAALVALAGIGVVVGRWITRGTDPVAEARRAYARGDWDRAAALARQQLQKSGSDPAAWRIYARATARLGRDEAASTIYKDRLGADRMEPEDYFLVGLGLVRLGRNETALQVWQKAARAGPEHPELLGSLAQQAIALGHLEEADAAARRLARQPGWEARGWLLLGEVQHTFDNPQGAAEALDRGLRLDPRARGLPLAASYYRRLLARSWLRVGRAAEAQEQLKRVLAAEAPDREAHWLLSRACLQRGQIEDAARALQGAGSSPTENPRTPEPGPYVGAACCAGCHRDINRTYQHTRHARTFHRGPGLLELPMPEGPLSDPDDPQVTLTFRRDGPRVHVETRAKDQVFDTVVAYAFGTRERYITMIGRDDEQTYRGVRLSYYRTAAGSGWDRTSGDVGAPDPHENVRGRPIEVRDGVVRCLHCHVTRPPEFRDPPPEVAGPEAADQAIGCERCHGPGGNHVAAIAAGFPDRAIAIVRGGTAPAEVVNAQCAECHTVDFRFAIAAAPEDPRFVRSPGMTLTFSKCFTQSGGSLSCLTCHDPHREREKTASFYEAICSSCHSRERTGSPPPAGRQSVCKVNPTRDCLNCHMPKVPIAELHTTLTDHNIRVHGRPGPRPRP